VKDKSAKTWGENADTGAGDKEISVVWRPENPEGFALPSNSDMDFKFTPPEVDMSEEPEFSWDVHDFANKADKPAGPEEFVWEMEEEKAQFPREPEENVKGQDGTAEEIDTLAKESSHEIDKFFTFSQKSAEFQKLLDMEYEKIHQASVPDRIEPEMFKDPDIEAVGVLGKEDIEPTVHLEQSEAESPVARESRQAAEMAAARNEFFKSEQETAGTGAEQEQQYDEAEEEDLTGDGDEEDDDDKNWGFAKSAVAVIVVVIILELALLGIKYFMPDSEAAEAIGDFQKNITAGVGGLYERITGGAEPEQEEPGSEQEEPGSEQAVEEEPEAIGPDPLPMADKDALIASQLAANKNIEAIKANSLLKYDPAVSYTDPAIKNSKPIGDNILYAPAEDEDGDAVYYDREIVAAIISFDSLWIDYVNSGDKAVLEVTKAGSQAYRNVENFSKAGKVTEKFLLLEIGELRQNGDQFYAWTHERIEVTEAGKTVVKDYRWIYKLEKAGKEMKIVNYYKY
jgi:hypothetical protein